MLGKCYTEILNKGLYDWLEDNNNIEETQAGSRRGYPTTDHVFTLNAITQKHLSKRGVKLYVTFIDLRKAFVSMKRETVLKTLCRVRVFSKFMNATKAVCQKAICCVRVSNKFKDTV